MNLPLIDADGVEVGGLHHADVFEHGLLVDHDVAPVGPYTEGFQAQANEAQMGLRDLELRAQSLARTVPLGGEARIEVYHDRIREVCVGRLGEDELRDGELGDWG